MHVNAAAGSASSESGRASITLALKGVPTLKRELSAELKRTA
jgi:mevalonate pyrophosphate decarboxylase